jgi:hypothetical protein
MASHFRPISGAPDDPLQAPGSAARTRRWRVINFGRNVMGTTMYLREHHFPNIFAGIVH